MEVTEPFLCPEKSFLENMGRDNSTNVAIQNNHAWKEIILSGYH